MCWHQHRWLAEHLYFLHKKYNWILFSGFPFKDNSRTIKQTRKNTENLPKSDPRGKVHQLWPCNRKVWTPKFIFKKWKRCIEFALKWSKPTRNQRLFPLNMCKDGKTKKKYVVNLTRTETYKHSAILSVRDSCMSMPRRNKIMYSKTKLMWIVICQKMHHSHFKTIKTIIII